MSQENKETTEKNKNRTMNVIGNGFLVLIAVVIPAITLAVEISSSLSASSYLDPIPTLTHVLLVASVPLINFIVWMRLRRPAYKRDRLLYILIYFSIAISLLYTIAYLPLTPLSFVLIIYAGFGLLPLAPLLSLIGSIIILSKFNAVLMIQDETQNLKKTQIKRFKFGFLGAISAMTVMAVLEVPGMLTNYGLSLYQSENQQTRQQGLKFLRRWGNETVMLNNCYARSLRLFDLGGYFFATKNSVRSQKMARAAFYQVTGKSFNKFAAPETRGTSQFGFRSIPGSRFKPDSDQGAQRVGGRVNKLWLHSSAIDGTVDTKAGIAYLEWTFEYKNTANVPQEARKEIQLPPNAVISRVTLWVNGEEREAVITSKGKATRAYRAIVRQRRDPILVTLTGKDRALIQMFPVPANGGVMKARIGITVPLNIQKSELAVLSFPKINSRNFNIDSQFKHSVWIETKQKNGLHFNQGVFANIKTNSAKWTGKILNTLSHKQYQNDQTVVVAKRQNLLQESYSVIPNKVAALLGIAGRIRQSITKSTLAYKKIIIVLDGSISMEKHRASIISALKNVPNNIKIEFIISADKPVVVHSTGLMTASARAKLIMRLQQFNFVGGANNILGLETAMEHSITRSDSDGKTAIVWVHAAQPYLLSSMSRINQYWKRNSESFTFFYVPAEPGSNKIIAAMPKSIAAYNMPKYNGLSNGLIHLIRSLSGDTQVYTRSYNLQVGAKTKSGSYKAGIHLIRLWAKNKVDRLLTKNTQENRTRAIKVSKHMRLVTPVSGAVVLETDKEYAQFGIKKTKLQAGMVPAVPEPATWLLLFMAGAMFIFMVNVQRRKSR